MSDDYKGLAEALGGLIQKTLEQLTTANTAAAPKPQDESSRQLFFPNGIELIHVVFKVAGNTELSVTLAGEKARNPVTPPDIVTATPVEPPKN
jgi:hypothetical protein